MIISFVSIVLFLTIHTQLSLSASLADAPKLNYQVKNIYPHDQLSYTQGLLWHKNQLYEGTGLYGHSKIAQVDLLTGQAIKQTHNSPRVFGEGITVFSNKLYQLTWRENIVYVYGLNDFKKIKEYFWPLEGWGLTNDAHSLIISTGESYLYWVNPEDFSVVSKKQVLFKGQPISMINELEYVDGYIYANQYLTNHLIKIDAKTAEVVGVLDLSDLFVRTNKEFIVKEPTEDVLNGIAYNPVSRNFYVTGKRWSYLFEINIE
ncbi:glutaminyl-peptide cyclotransferase [Neisseria sp. Ec49-e6-T10]|uniref:glutaminyl-peptide cyclotransferase n=1 Tax=Neisseria sp. Ec49-e6-T10 TaxID=3140744 RepID=UPI003EBCD140